MYVYIYTKTSIYICICICIYIYIHIYRYRYRYKTCQMALGFPFLNFLRRPLIWFSPHLYSCFFARCAREK